MSRIFISYRRDDTADTAGRLADHLRTQLGADQVFIDVDTIDAGEDFVDRIRRDVGSCDILLAVIGRRWLAAQNEAGQRRLDDPGDFVRLEVATALERSIRVVPVLVQRAAMPKGSELPADLAALATRNAFELRDTSFSRDVEELVRKLTGQSWSWQRLVRRPAAWAAAVAVLAVAATLGVLATERGRSTVPDGRTKGGNPPAPSPYEVPVRLSVHPDGRFGPVDASVAFLLGHLSPRYEVRNRRYLETDSPQPPFVYSSSAWMPAATGENYLGRLERVIERGILSDVELAQTRALAAMEVCFERAADAIQQPPPPVLLECREGQRCQVTKTAVVRRCGEQASRGSGWITAAHAQASPPVAGADKDALRWLVPSLTTLRRLKGTPRAVGYSEFSLVTDALTMPGVDVLGYAIRVNDTPVHIDGWPPEAQREPFDPAKGLRLEFGLENLDFSGKQEGYEFIDVALEFLQDQRVVRKEALRLRYVALRDAAPCAVNVAADLTIRWHAEYVNPPREDTHQIFLLSSKDVKALKLHKQNIDRKEVSLRAGQLVAIVRPPLGPSEWFGLNLGVRQPTGQVRFTFDEATATKHKDEASRIARATDVLPHEPSLRPVGARRAVTPCRP